MPAAESAASPSDDGLTATLRHLLAENAALKRKLQTPTEQRILESVVSRQVDALFREAAVMVAEERAKAGVATAVGSNERSLAAEDGGAQEQQQQQQPLVSEALEALCAEKAAVEGRLRGLLSGVLASLREQVAVLELDRAALTGKVSELELAAANRAPPAFVVELEALRRSEALCRAQLAEVQSGGASAAERTAAIARDGLAAARALPDCADAVSAEREGRRAAEAREAVLALELAEQRSRFAVLAELSAGHAADDAAAAGDRAGLLTASLGSAVERERSLVAEKAALEAQVRHLQGENERLSTGPATSDEDAQRAKRRRVEEAVATGDHSATERARFIRFWYDGREAIRALEAELAAAKGAATDLRVSQGRVAQLERSHAATVSHLAAVSQEVARVREEGQRLRAQAVGLEVERDQLIALTADSLGGASLSRRELEECCRTIRQSAARSAAASAAVVADPAAVREAVRRAQELQSEVAVLQRQRDKLAHYITVQEQRVSALTERSAMAAVLGCGGGAGQQSLLMPVGIATLATTTTTANTTTTSLTLPQFLDAVTSGARDILWESERAAIGVLDDPAAVEAALSRYRVPFAALQEKLLESQTALLASQRRLQEALGDRTSLAEGIDRARAELAASMAARDGAAAALEETNAALLVRTAALGSQRRELRRQLSGVVGLGGYILSALGGVFGLFQREVAHVQELRELISQERADMMELVRQGGGSNTNSDGQQQTAAVMASALERLSGFIQAAVEDTSLARAEQRTEFLRRLVAMVQDQERRVADMQSEFVAAARQQAGSLAGRVTAAQKGWESTWRDRCRAVEGQRDQLSALVHSQTALYTALEGATVVVPQPTATSATRNEDEEVVGSGGGDGKGGAPSTQETITAIDGFIQRARQEHLALAAAAAAASPPVPPQQPHQQPQQLASAPIAAAAPAAWPPPTEEIQQHQRQQQPLQQPQQEQQQQQQQAPAPQPQQEQQRAPTPPQPQPHAPAPPVDPLPMEPWPQQQPHEPQQLQQQHQATPQEPVAASPAVIKALPPPFLSAAAAVTRPPMLNFGAQPAPLPDQQPQQQPQPQPQPQQQQTPPSLPPAFAFAAPPPAALVFGAAAHPSPFGSTSPPALSFGSSPAPIFGGGVGGGVALIAAATTGAGAAPPFGVPQRRSVFGALSPPPPPLPQLQQMEPSKEAVAESEAVPPTFDEGDADEDEEQQQQQQPRRGEEQEEVEQEEEEVGDANDTAEVEGQGDDIEREEDAGDGGDQSGEAAVDSEEGEGEEGEFGFA